MPLYAWHRWASTIIHPGFGGYQVYRRFEATEVLRALHGPFAALLVHASLIFKTITSGVGSPAMVTTQAVLQGTDFSTRPRSSRA